MALITKKGLEKLKERLLCEEKLEAEALHSVAIARGFGDLSENAELEAAKIDLDRSQANINQIKKEILESQIFDITNINEEIVGFGVTVTIADENDKEIIYTILGNNESDISKGILSINSPIASAMIGKKINDSFVFFPPAGEKNYTILNISYNFDLFI